MNAKVSKMLRRLGKSNKAGKKEYNSFNHMQKGWLSADYAERGDTAKKNYTEMKKRRKNEQISDS